MPDENLSVVYVLTNPAMPGLVKIGKTSQDDHATRVSQLYTTGVPVPFDIEYACKVPNPADVEKALHTAFAPQRQLSGRTAHYWSTVTHDLIWNQGWHSSPSFVKRALAGTKSRSIQ